MRNYLVKENLIGSALGEILRYTHTQAHRSCYFIIRIYIVLGAPAESGIYKIWVNEEFVDVYCDMEKGISLIRDL